MDSGTSLDNIGLGETQACDTAASNSRTIYITRGEAFAYSLEKGYFC